MEEFEEHWSYRKPMPPAAPFLVLGSLIAVIAMFAIAVAVHLALGAL